MASLQCWLQLTCCFTLTCLLLATRLSARALSGNWTDGVSSSEGFFGFQASRPTSPDPIARPTSPDGLGGGMYTSYGMSQGLEGLICAAPSAVRRHRLAFTLCLALWCATCLLYCCCFPTCCCCCCTLLLLLLPLLLLLVLLLVFCPVSVTVVPVRMTWLMHWRF